MVTALKLNLEYNMKASAWRIPTGIKGDYLYHLQVDGHLGRSKQKVYRIMDDWRLVGDGPSMAIFSRSFDSIPAWVKWAKSFPLELEELDSKTDKPKKIKLGLASHRRKKRKTK
tara:strand:+ start:5325 stop:5666 length:342 start_codon:yes stop_codon:yes gene_type:complete